MIDGTEVWSKRFKLIAMATGMVLIAAAQAQAQQPYPAPGQSYPSTTPAYPNPSYPSTTPAYPNPGYPTPTPAYPNTASPSTAYPSQQPGYPVPGQAYPGGAPQYPGYPNLMPTPVPAPSHFFRDLFAQTLAVVLQTTTGGLLSSIGGRIMEWFARKGNNSQGYNPAAANPNGGQYPQYPGAGYPNSAYSSTTTTPGYPSAAYPTSSYPTAGPSVSYPGAVQAYPSQASANPALPTAYPTTAQAYPPQTSAYATQPPAYPTPTPGEPGAAYPTATYPTGAQTAGAYPTATQAYPAPGYPTQAPAYPTQAGATTPAAYAAAGTPGYSAAPPQVYDARTGLLVTAASNPYATRGLGMENAVYAGIAYEVHALAANGQESPVNSATYEFHTGDKFMVYYRPSLPGHMEIYNVNTAGQQTLIDSSNMAAGQMTSLGPYQFTNQTGDESLRLVLSPCSSPQLLAATRDIVRADASPQSVPANTALKLASCGAPAARGLDVHTRNIEKVGVEGTTSFALDPLYLKESSSGQVTPREAIIVFHHR
jgi:hypothetical protein